MTITPFPKQAVTMNTDGAAKVLGTRCKIALADAGFATSIAAAHALSVAHGGRVGQTSVSALFRGEVGQPRYLSAIMAVTGKSESWLRGFEEQSVLQSAVSAPVLGEIRAGAFYPKSQDAYLRTDSIQVATDPRFPNTKLYAYLVADDAMASAGFHQNQYAICIEYDGRDIPLRDKLSVVVERTIDGGNLVERTIRVVRDFRERSDLHLFGAASHVCSISKTDQRTDGEGHSVQIVGIVVRTTQEFEI